MTITCYDNWQAYFRTNNEKGPGADGSAEPAEGTVAAAIEFPHYQNFIDAVRAGDPKPLNGDIVEGHYTSSLPHLGQHRVPGRSRSRVRR